MRGGLDGQARCLAPAGRPRAAPTRTRRDPEQRENVAYTQSGKLLGVSRVLPRDGAGYWRPTSGCGRIFTEELTEWRPLLTGRVLSVQIVIATVASWMWRAGDHRDAARRREPA